MTAPILIFGARGGIGEALARRLAAAGRPLVLTGRQAEQIEPLARELNAGWAVCDVMDAQTIRSAVDTAAQDGKGLAGLAYCVGSIVLKPLRAATETDFLQHFRLNAVGAALAVQAARDALIRAEGSVVMFSTVAVRQGFANHAVIAAAKGAVEGLTLALAAELAPKVRINAVAPSLTRTTLSDAMVSNETLAKGIAALHALGRLGEPEDAATLAAFLLGPDSGWITGQVIGVDGGRSTLRTKG